MQQTQELTTKSPVHIKVAYNNEFRRFLLSPASFDNLKTTLKTSFSLETEFNISFKDDENDWVLLTTDEELNYAIELAGSPLRLQILPEATKVVPVASPQRGRGRGCRGGTYKVAAEKPCKSREEKLAQKASRLSERITILESKLDSKKFTSEREAVISRKVRQLQANLAVVQSMQVCLPNSEIPEETNAEIVLEFDPVPTEETPSEDQEKASFRGRRGRGGGRGCRKVRERCDGRIKRKALVGRLSPEILENFRQCKTLLQVAREYGSPEEIQSCLEAFRAAKAAKCEALTALRAEEQQ